MWMNFVEDTIGLLYLKDQANRFSHYVLPLCGQKHHAKSCRLLSFFSTLRVKRSINGHSTCSWSLCLWHLQQTHRHLKAFGRNLSALYLCDSTSITYSPSVYQSPFLECQDASIAHECWWYHFARSWWGHRWSGWCYIILTHTHQSYWLIHHTS